MPAKDTNTPRIEGVNDLLERRVERRQRAKRNIKSCSHFAFIVHIAQMAIYSMCIYIYIFSFFFYFIYFNIISFIYIFFLHLSVFIFIWRLIYACFFYLKLLSELMDNMDGLLNVIYTVKINSKYFEREIAGAVN